mgnify:CR=1 FL=1
MRGEIAQAEANEGQLDDLISEINIRTEKNERTLVTTLTKKMAEDLTDYFEQMDIRVRYMHHDIDTVERMEIIRDLRCRGNRKFLPASTVTEESVCRKRNRIT